MPWDLGHELSSAVGLDSDLRNGLAVDAVGHGFAQRVVWSELGRCQRRQFSSSLPVGATSVITPAPGEQDGPRGSTGGYEPSASRFHDGGACV